MSDTDAQRSNRRYIAKYGRTTVLTNYSEGGEDAYGDSTINPDTATISAIIERYKGDFKRDASGGIPTGDAVMYVDDTATIYQGATNIASMLTADDEDYVVKQLDPQGTGMIAVLVEKIRP